MGKKGSGSARKARRSERKQHAARSGAPSREEMEALIAPYRAGRAADAAAVARRFTKRWPREAAGWGILSESTAALGQLDAAIEAGRQLVRVDRDNSRAHATLGLLLEEANQREPALEAYRQALELRPDDAEIRYNLANILRDMGQLERAVEAYRQAIRHRSDWAEAYNNLGNVLRKLGRPEEAVEALERAAALRPSIALVLNNLANALLDTGRYGDAEAALRRALELEPRYPECYNNLGRVLRSLHRPYEAERAWRYALELRPEMAEARYNLGNILHELGRIEDAEASYRQCLEHWPNAARLHHYLALSKRFVENDPDLDRIEALLQRAGDLPDEESLELHYAAAKAYTDIGSDPARAFEHLATGARLKRGLLNYDVAADEALFERIAQHFSSAWIRDAAEYGEDTETPIFIVGMPRSGTSLVEQILATHGEVDARGELPDLERHLIDAARADGAELGDWLVDASPEALAAVGRSYRESVIDSADGVSRVTDKMPGNFRFAGVIAAGLPGAHIVHVQRDPADTCFACFRQLFVGLDFTYDLRELGRYYQAYAELMEHWRRVLPEGRLLEVQYEELVGEPEREIRRLLDFCGLEWDPACLEFHRTERAVQTASADQVRQPLYTSSIGRWRKYREQLAPLLEELGPLAPEA